MKRFFTGITVTLMLTVLIGCGGYDTNQILVHPESVKPSQPIDVTLMNIFSYMANGTTIEEDVVRDSLHLLVGIPATWQVHEVKMAVVKDLFAGVLSGLSENTDDTAFNAMMQQYQAQALPVPTDGGVATALSGKTFSADDESSGNSVDVTVGTAPTWAGFSAPVNIVLAKDSKPDTVINTDSMLTMASDLGVMDDSIQQQIDAFKALGVIPDSIGISMVPIIVYLKLQAGSQEAEDNLYYYSKTGSLSFESSGGMDISIDSGGMSFASISVSNSAAAITALPRIYQDNQISIKQINGNVTIIMTNVVNSGAKVGIYTLNGDLVRTIHATTDQHTILWNGTDISGARVGAGIYLVHVTDKNGSYSASVRMQP